MSDRPSWAPDHSLIDELPCISCEGPSSHRTPDGWPVCDDCCTEDCEPCDRCGVRPAGWFGGVLRGGREMGLCVSCVRSGGFL